MHFVISRAHGKQHVTDRVQLQLEIVNHDGPSAIMIGCKKRTERCCPVGEETVLCGVASFREISWSDIHSAELDKTPEPPVEEAVLV